MAWPHPCPAPLLEEPSPSPCFLSYPKATLSISCHSWCHRLCEPGVWRASLLSRLVPVLSPAGLPVPASAAEPDPACIPRGRMALLHAAFPQTPLLPRYPKPALDSPGLPFPYVLPDPSAVQGETSSPHRAWPGSGVPPSPGDPWT